MGRKDEATLAEAFEKVEGGDSQAWPEENPRCLAKSKSTGEWVEFYLAI